MAQIHPFRRPPPPRRPWLNRGALAWAMLLAGTVAACLALLTAELRALSTLLGLGIAIGGYLALYDHASD